MAATRRRVDERCRSRRSVHVVGVTPAVAAGTIIRTTALVVVLLAAHLPVGLLLRGAGPAPGKYGGAHVAFVARCQFIDPALVPPLLVGLQTFAGPVGGRYDRAEQS